MPYNTDLSLPLVIAHRGASGHAPENTVAAIHKAAELGARSVEFDVKLTGCGCPILMHDDGLGRTTGLDRAVRETPLASIKALDAGSWFAPEFAGEPVPTLEEAVDALVELNLSANVEIKPCPGREVETGRVVGEWLKTLWPASRPLPLVSSFSSPALAACARAAPELPRGLLLPWLPKHAQLTAALRHTGAVSVHINHQFLSSSQVRALTYAGYRVLTYTVNDPERYRALLGWGVDAVITDFPDRLIDGDDMAATTPVTLNTPSVGWPMDKTA